MRRLILIVMMFVLPFQWSWAAAASLCQHEAEGAHFGHHEHKHEASSHGGGPADLEKAGKAEKGDTKSPGFHPDCLVCHGIGAAYVPAAADVGPGWVPDRPASSYGQYLPEPPVESFLRPPLSFVA